MSKRSSGNGRREERGNEFLSLVKYVLRTKGPLSVAFLIVRRTCLFSERNLFPRGPRLALTLGALGLLLAALPILAKTPPKAKTMPRETAVIENTGSTNTEGYQITVYSDKSAVVTMHFDNPRITRVTASYGPGKFPYTSKLFKDLEAAPPLTSLPVQHGMRSASFGTQTYITYKGQRSPDLTFGGDANTAALKADVDTITRWLGFGNVPRRPVVQAPQSETH